MVSILFWMDDKTGPADRGTPGPAAESFGKWLERWLARLHRSSDEIAAAVRVSPLTAYRWRRGLNQPKSKHLRERVVQLVRGWGADDVPTDLQGEETLPLDDRSSKSFLLVARSNPVLEREGAEFALKELLKAGTNVTYVLLEPKIESLELYVFPMFLAVIRDLDLNEPGYPLRMDLWRQPPAQPVDAGVYELFSLLLGDQVITASLTKKAEANPLAKPNATLMRRGATFDRHLPKVNETRITLSRASFDALFDVNKMPEDSFLSIKFKELDSDPTEYTKKLRKKL